MSADNGSMGIQVYDLIEWRNRLTDSGCKLQLREWPDEIWLPGNDSAVMVSRTSCGEITSAFFELLGKTYGEECVPDKCLLWASW